jgi:hypothetical protein
MIVGERLKPKTEGSTHLTYTGLHGGLERLKIETRLIHEMFPTSIFKIIRSTTVLGRILSIFDFSWEENAVRW